MFKKVLIGIFSVAAIGAVVVLVKQDAPSVGPSPSPSASVSVTATPKASTKPSPSKTVAPTLSPTHTPSPTPIVTITPTPTQAPTPTPTQTLAPTSTPDNGGGGGGSTPTPTPMTTPQMVEIVMHDFSFNPGTLNIHPGDIVRFTNSDMVAHSAVADGEEWATPVLNPGQSFELNTNTLPLGTYRYHCGIHGAGEAGTLRIRN